jgi:hypothetical protein
MKGQRIEYFEDELAWIEARRDWPRKDLHQSFVARFDRQDVSQTNLTALCKRKGWLTGRTGRFVAGQEAFNKGKSMPAHPNSVATRFKKGGLSHNTKHLGHERLSKEGYVEISVAETNPHTGYERRYVHKHRWLWEKANGPIPKDHVLKCIDGDKSNTDPSNWEAIPRAILPRLNGRFGRGYDSASPEVKPTILLVAKLEHQAREMKKGEKV